MKISGFSFVRNAIKFDYPFRESIQSLLPLCDEFVIAVGKSDDRTMEEIRALGNPKISVFETVWDENLRSGGVILAQQTNLALQHVTGDWAVYLQADEVLHENDLPIIRASMETHLNNPDVEGLLFPYFHFYGSYRYIGTSTRWYRNEIRAFKTGIGVESWGDAQGFRVRGRKLQVKPVNAHVYHYGWVKPPEVQQLKQQDFNKLWHSDNWVEQNVGMIHEYDYTKSGKLETFQGSHPAVMKKRIAQADWYFDYDESKHHSGFKEGVLDFVEKHTGYRIGEYKNYRIV